MVTSPIAHPPEQGWTVITNVPGWPGYRCPDPVADGIRAHLNSIAPQADANVEARVASFETQGAVPLNDMRKVLGVDK